ncbi:MAG: hypothetical protein WAV00_02580 [Nocardioides sp.]
MPWVPELFSAPVLQRVLDQRRRDALVAMPYFDGLLAGDPDPLVESFAGAPQLYDPIRGRVKDEAAFRAFVTETSAWLREHEASVDDVEHVILEHRGFEEVVLHVGTERGRVDLPVAVVADRRPEGRIDGIRVYFDTEPLTGQSSPRAPLLQPDTGLAVPAAVASYVEAHGAAHGARLEPCALVDDGRACAVEYNVVRPGTALEVPEAGLAVFVADGSGGLAAVRVYGDGGA